MFRVSNNTSFTLQINSSYAEDRVSSGSFSQAKPAPRRPDEYFTIWSEWEKNVQPGATEEGDVAVAKMSECMKKNAGELNLSHLGLSSSPEVIPERIAALLIYNNQLTCSPARLPKNLTFLDVSDNNLQLSPDSIEFLNASKNNLEAIPNRLPSCLQLAGFEDNNIVSLNANLPDGIT